MQRSLWNKWFIDMFVTERCSDGGVKNQRPQLTSGLLPRNTLLSKESLITQLLLLLSKLLALLTGTVRVRALSAVLADVAGALGVLAGLLRIFAFTGHFE